MSLSELIMDVSMESAGLARARKVTLDAQSHPKTGWPRRLPPTTWREPWQTSWPMRSGTRTPAKLSG